METMDGYVRVSRVGKREGDSFISPKVQRAAIERWAASHGIKIVQWHEDLDVSGSKMSRPSFDAMLKRVESGQTGGVVVAKLDRFARSLVGALDAIKRIDDVGAKFVSTSDSFDTGTANGRLILKIMLSLAEFELERIRDSWETAEASAIARGVHISPDVPYGYDKDERKLLVPNDAAPFVLKAFEYRAAGWTWAKIARYLNDDAPKRSDDREWIDKTVERMIRRKVYLGIAHWGEYENLTAHPALVSDALWHAAQRKVQTHSRQRQGDDIALLHGIVRCAGCRFQMSRALNRSGGYERHYYRCRVHRASGRCELPAAIRAHGDDSLEAYVESLVCAELERRNKLLIGTEDSTSFADAMRELDHAQRDLDEFRQDTQARRRLGKRFNDFLEPLLSAVEDAESRVAELREAQSGPDISSLAPDAYRALSREERATVIAAMIDAVMVRNVGGPKGPQAVAIDERRVRVLWRGEGPTDLPATNRASELVPWDWPQAA